MKKTKYICKRNIISKDIRAEAERKNTSMLNDVSTDKLNRHEGK